MAPLLARPLEPGVATRERDPTVEISGESLPPPLRGKKNSGNRTARAVVGGIGHGKQHKNVPAGPVTRTSYSNAAISTQSEGRRRAAGKGSAVTYRSQHSSWQQG